MKTELINQVWQSDTLFRSLLNDARLGDTDTAEISENEWLGVMSRV
jgi:hypothetical protein